MKTQKFGVLAALAMAGIAFAQAGEGGSETGVGNGGGAWVCRERSGAIRWAQVVDIFEAEAEFRLLLARQAGTHSQVLERILDRVRRADPNFLEALQPYLRYIGDLRERGTDIVHTPHTVTVVEDALWRVSPGPESCRRGSISYGQVVNFKDDGGILVHPGLLRELDSVNRAALVIHEAVYAYRRARFRDRNSLVSRRIVGLIFSDLPVNELRESLANVAMSALGTSEMRFVPIQPGRFVMGDELDSFNYDRHPHSVELTRGFEIQSTEVTQAQWFSVMGNNPSVFKIRPKCIETYREVDGVALCPDHPVENVSFDDVREFLRRLNSQRGGAYTYRLPTDAEWEYAARAGSQTRYGFGNDPMQVSLHAVVAGYQLHSSTLPVGSRRPNPWGLYDMHGNVREWVSDHYALLVGGAPAIDPRGPVSAPCRTLRGESYRSGLMTIGYRQRACYPSRGTDDVGFRLVRTSSDF